MSSCFCRCYHCKNGIQFDPVDAGRDTACPHCAAPIRLYSDASLGPANPAASSARNLAADRSAHFHKTAKWISLTLAAIAGILIIGAIIWSGVEWWPAIAIFILLLIYFIPAFNGRHKRNAGGILALNFFLGWTFLGWVIALVWSCCTDPDTA